MVETSILQFWVCHMTGGGVRPPDGRASLQQDRPTRRGCERVERKVDFGTVDAVEALHQLGLYQIGALIDDRRYDDARQVADILAKVGVI